MKRGRRKEEAKIRFLKAGQPEESMNSPYSMSWQLSLIWGAVSFVYCLITIPAQGSSGGSSHSQRQQSRTRASRHRHVCHLRLWPWQLLTWLRQYPPCSFSFLGIWHQLVSFSGLADVSSELPASEPTILRICLPLRALAFG